MRRSWRKRATVLLLALLVMVGLFFGWTSVNYSVQLKKTVDEENARSAVLWAGMTEARLDAVYEHIYELLITLYNNTELRADTPIMSARTRARIVEMMNDKLLVSEHADAFFVFDTQNDYYLFSAKKSLPSQEILAIKTYAHDNAAELSRFFGDRSWLLYTIENGSFFMKSVRLGKYIVGAFSSTGHYMAEQSVNILGKDSSCLVEAGENLYYFGGNGAHTDAAEFEKLKRERLPGVSVVSAPLPTVDGTVYFVSHIGSLLSGSGGMAFLLLADAAVCMLLVVGLLILLRRKVSRPTAQLMEANRRLAAGDTRYRLDASSSGSREFEALYDSFNNMASQIVSLRIEAYDMKLAEEQNKLTMLRAQLRPHTFLNAITTISNMTFSSPPEEIRAYISDLAKFVRYMLKTSSPWTTVKEEISNIRSYLNMQERRSPDCVHLMIECDQEAAGARIPYLLLFSLMENSVKHAMTLYAPMELRIGCVCEDGGDFKGIHLTVEDNGDGFPEEVLERFRSEQEDPVFTKEHLGLSNVRYTLRLVYHHRARLLLSNREKGGARVEIWIPEETSDEASDL